MRIVQTTFGVFHHFELARELERRGHLDRIYSTWPKFRLRRERLPDAKVGTFPWIHTVDYAAHRSGKAPIWLTDHTGYANALLFDEYTLWQMRRRRPADLPDCLIGLAGSSLKTGAWLQERGKRFVCDRGSSHQRYQEQIVQDEYARWGVERPSSDERDNVREDKIYAQADLIVVPSSFARRSFLEMDVPGEKVRKIPYGVRLEQFSPGPLQGFDTFDVLFAGQVGLRKGFPYALQAFAALKHPRKRLRVVGHVLSDVKGVLPSLPTDNVDFLGVLPQAELAQWMQRSHLLILPSVEEGLALVQAQAMASGCPVLCSTNTGGEDLFTDGVEGFVVPIRDVASLTDRMERLAGDRELWERMRAASLERVRTIGGWSAYGQAWETLLQELCASER